MASDSEDLEFNPFYQALQSRTFISQYEHAQQHCWLVCVPRATSIEGCIINKQFVNMHLLEPSVMFRDRYHSIIGGQSVTWHLRGNIIQCMTSNGSTINDTRVTIIGEELAYNRAMQQFKIFILSQPLDPEYKPSGSLSRVQDGLRVRQTFQEQRELLFSFHNYKRPISELNSRISSFLQTYIVVEVESLLQDTASKLRAMAKQTASLFLEANKRDERLADRRIQENVWLAVEGYLLGSVHSKVYPAVCKLHKKEETLFKERCVNLRGKLTPEHVGMSEDYHCTYHKTIKQLNKMDAIQSPIEGLYTFQDALDCIMDDVREHFTKCLRHGEPSPLASDDLIALLASIIVLVDCPHFLSSLYYMENFHWSLTEADKLSFSLVTLRAAVEYIRGPEVEKLLPKMEDIKKQARHKTPLYRDGSLSSSTDISTSDSWNSIGSLGISSLAISEEIGREEKEELIVDRVPPSRSGRRRQEGSRKKKAEVLGPFLSMLMDEDTVTSSSFYSDPN